MREDDLTAGLMDVVRLNGLLEDGSAAPEDVAAVLQALGAEEAAPAVSAMSRHACGALLSGAEAGAVLGVPSEGRNTRCFVYGRPGGQEGFAAVAFETETIRRAARGMFGSAGAERMAEALGCPLPSEVALRIERIDARPGMASHFASSAADHMAAHVEGLLRELPGMAESGDGRFLWTAAFPKGKAAEALAWLSLPGPGAFASSVTAFIPVEGMP